LINANPEKSPLLTISGVKNYLITR